jgi:peptidoglycan/xylan/chitin deacetylase (PgdA/CDA1 family)
MKETGAWLYQQLTGAQRADLLRQLQNRANVPVAILFYHRIADRDRNPWTMSRCDFARQLDWLQETCDVVCLQEAKRRIACGQNSRRTVSLTFDDGYGENAEFAIPELVRRGLSATYFVATDFVASGKPFPHDLAAGVPLRPNSIDELREFAEQGIEIGAHTRSHCDLGQVTCPQRMREEILGSAEQIQQWLARPVRYFAFPYGLPHNTSQLAVDVIAQHGFAGFCTAYGAWNWPKLASTRFASANLTLAKLAAKGTHRSNSTMHLKRIHADPGIERLKNWLTLDRRKLDDSSELPFSELQVALAGS